MTISNLAPRPRASSGIHAPLRAVGLMLLAFAAFACTPKAVAQVEFLDPTSSFTARSIGVNVLVGNGTPSNEGKIWQTRILEIKEGTSDRAVLEFDLRGRSQQPQVLFEFYLYNLDAPSFTNIFLYSFEANGLANAADYFRADNLITTFTDNGMADGFFIQDLEKSSLDVTAAYNNGVANGHDYLGLLLRNSTAGPMYARYRLGNGATEWPLPRLRIGVPEPSSAILVATGAVALSVGRNRRRGRRAVEGRSGPAIESEL
jgi:hypothetical protein